MLLSIPLTFVATRALSEPVFILLLTLALIYAAQFLDAGQRRALLLAALFTALACLTRYSGVAIVIAIGLLLLCRRASWTDRAQNAALYSTIALLPLGVWILRNYLLTGLYTGYRAPSETTLPEHLTTLLHTLATWLLPIEHWPEGNAFLPTLLGLLTLTPVALAGILAVRQWRAQGRVSGMLLVPAAFIPIYLSFLVISATVTILNPLKNELLSPVYVPLLFAVVPVVSYWTRHNFCPPPPQNSGCPVSARRLRWRRRLPAALRRAPLIGLFLWLAYPIAANAADIHRSITAQTGWYSNALWADSEHLPRLKRELAGIDYARLYSNDVFWSYFHAGAPARWLPTHASELHSIYQNPAAAGIYILWTEVPQVAWTNYARSDLEQALPNPQTVIASPDVALFYVSPASIADGAAASEKAAAAAVYATTQALGAPAVSAVYDLYIDGNRLIYLKEPCNDTDTAAPFFLHIVPAHSADLPTARLPYGFDNRDFAFNASGWHYQGKCLAVAELPEYDIALIRTGQHTDGGIIWETHIDFRLPAVQQMQLAALADRQPAINDHFAVYLLDGQLAYLKEPCTLADTAAPFYLHLLPAERSNLPPAQKEYGFDNRDFAFDARGWRYHGKCLATVALPDYAIVHIRTGQYTDAGRLWQSEFPVEAP